MSGNGVNQDHWSIIGQDVGGHPKQWIALFVVWKKCAMKVGSHDAFGIVGISRGGIF
jgi:hypothetical protein